MNSSVRADLYALLAEALAEPPDWMSLSGNEWPLIETVSDLASEFEAAHHLDFFACIPPEEPHLRQKRYTSIFASGKPRIWLYESAASTGRILGTQTFEMARLYRSAGLETVGAELPDHISLELAFLSYLAGSSQEKYFLENHASWMIDLGRALACSGDEVYAPIGALLADWLRFAIAAYFPHKEDRSKLRVPTLPHPDDCTLCGFCVQVCPTPALKIVEEPKNTLLVFEGTECIHCGKCEKICEFHALEMNHSITCYAKLQVLRQSPHVNCQNCGQFIASQAEMDYIVSRIGDAVWQNFCLDCRPVLFAH